VFSYFEDRPDEYLDLKHTCLLGHGLGLLSAAAVEGCKSLANLAFTASEVVRIALRTALHVSCVSKCLEPASQDAIWSATILGTTETDVKRELMEFYQSHVSV
jgi:malonyl CoA-acyl carrier protein transacylase